MKKVLSVSEFSRYLSNAGLHRYIYASDNQSNRADRMVSFVHRFKYATASISPNVIGFLGDDTSVSFYGVVKVELEPVVPGKNAGVIIRLVCSDNKKYSLVAS